MSQEILSQSEREAILSRLAGLGYTPEELNEAIAEHEGDPRRTPRRLLRHLRQICRRINRR